MEHTARRIPDSPIKLVNLVCRRAKVFKESSEAVSGFYVVFRQQLEPFDVGVPTPSINLGIVDPHVEPVEFSSGSNGKVVVEVHQIVRDLQGKLLADQMVGHIFQIENGLVRRFDIRGK